MARKIVCHSCGSTDVTIDPPWYRCNHCGTRHLLPPEATFFTSLKDRLKRRFLLVMALVALLAGGMVYLYLQYSKLSAASTPAAKPQKRSPSKPAANFQNLVFPDEILSEISLFAKTAWGEYLVAGRSPRSNGRVILLDTRGKKRWIRDLDNAYRVVSSSSDHETVTLALRAAEGGKVVKLDSTGKVLYEKPRRYTAIVEAGDGIIGVEGGKIEALDSRGNLLWRRIVDSRKTTRKVGGRRDPVTGKMLPYYRTLDRMRLRFVLRLHNGDYTALGTVDGRIAVILFDGKGTIRHKELYDLGRTYPDAVTATKNGGLLLAARRGLRLFSFDGEGRLQWRRTLENSRRIYTRTVVRTADGYLVASSLSSSGSKIQILHLDAKGRVLKKNLYAKAGVRLHPVSLVPTGSGDFLLAVSTEIHKPWIVRVLSDGTLDADLNDPTRRAGERTPPAVVQANKSESDQKIEPFPSATPMEVNHEAPKSVTVTTRRILGGNPRQILVSKNGKILYLLTKTTGLKILRKKEDGTFSEVGNLRRSATPLKISPHRILPENGKIPKRGSLYDYDTPWAMRLDEGQHRLYIADSVHGFYIVDVQRPEHPRVIAQARGLKLHSFVIGPEGAIRFYSGGKLRKLAIEEIIQRGDKIRMDDGDGSVRLALLEEGRIVAVTEKELVKLYRTENGELLHQFNLGMDSHVSLLKSDGKKRLLIRAGHAYNKIILLELGTDRLLRERFRILHAGFVHDIAYLPERNRLCVADKKGVLCYDLHDPANPTPSLRLTNRELSAAVSLLNNEHELIIVFYPLAIGSHRLSLSH